MVYNDNNANEESPYDQLSSNLAPQEVDKTDHDRDFRSLTLDDFWNIVKQNDEKIPLDKELLVYVDGVNKEQYNWEFINSSLQDSEVVARNKKFMEAFLSVLRENYQSDAVSYALTRLLHSAGYREKDIKNFEEGRIFLTKRRIQYVLNELDALENQPCGGFLQPDYGVSFPNNEFQQPYPGSYFPPPPLYPLPPPPYQAPYLTYPPPSYLDSTLANELFPLMPPLPPFLPWLHSQAPSMKPPYQGPDYNAQQPSRYQKGWNPNINAKEFTPIFSSLDRNVSHRAEQREIQKIEAVDPFVSSSSSHHSKNSKNEKLALAALATGINPNNKTDLSTFEDFGTTTTRSGGSSLSDSSKKEEPMPVDYLGQRKIKDGQVKKALERYFAHKEEEKIEESKKAAKKIIRRIKKYLAKAKEDGERRQAVELVMEDLKTYLENKEMLEAITRQLVQNLRNINTESQPLKESTAPIFQQKEQENGLTQNSLIDETELHVKNSLQRVKELTTQVPNIFLEEIGKLIQEKSLAKFSDDFSENLDLKKEVSVEKNSDTKQKKTCSKKKTKEKIKKLWHQVLEELSKDPDLLHGIKAGSELTDPELQEQLQKIIPGYYPEPVFQRAINSLIEGVTYYREHPQEAFNDIFNKHLLPPWFLMNAIVALQVRVVFGPESAVPNIVRVMPVVVANAIFYLCYYERINNYIANHLAFEQVMDYQNRYTMPAIDQSIRERSRAILNKVFMHPAGPYLLQLSTYAASMVFHGANSLVTKTLLAMSIGHSLYFFMKVFPDYQRGQQQLHH